MNPTQLALVFPGQGSQSPGMGQAFLAHAACRELAESINETLHLNLTNIMAEGPEEALRPTEIAQPALLTAGLLAFTYLQTQLNRPLPTIAAAVAGHSLGEYTAIAAAGGMSAPVAATLVRLRGESMAKAVPTGQGAMLALIGLPVEKAETLATATGSFLANDNSDGQCILSGPVEAIQKAEEAAKEAGAKRALRLNVSGPFHTPAMAPAAQAVETFLQIHPLHPLAVPCTMNSTAKPHTSPQETTSNLITQITSRVRWRESMISLANQGITYVAELGCGKVLTGLAPRCDARLTATALDTPAAIDTFLETHYSN